MLDSLKRAIDQIFGSVIQPIVDWILHQSWIVRLLCLVVISLAAFTWWKPQAVLGTAQDASSYWRMWVNDADHIPIPKSAQHSLALAMRRIAPSVEADLSAKLDQSPMTPWSASQSVLALRLDGQEIPDKDGYLAFVNSRRAAPDCFCWTELEEQPRSEAAVHISGWVMAAFAEIGTPVSKSDLDYILARQNGAGWWAMFPESGASQYESTYATGWVTLGLYKQRAAGLVPAEMRAPVDGAIRRATEWLVHSRNGARWKAHPNLPGSTEPEVLSGFILHVLHEVGATDLADVDRSWLQALPRSNLDPNSLDTHYVVLQYGHSAAIDHFAEVRLPWILLATADAYASGTPAQKARTLNWFNRVLGNPAVRSADTEGVEWVRAELLLGMGEAGMRFGCSECRRAS